MVQMFGWSRAEAAWASCRNRCFAESSRVRVRREELDGHLALQARVVGRVDDPHPAVAEFGGDRVRAESGARREGHGKDGLYLSGCPTGHGRGNRDSEGAGGGEGVL